MSDERNWEHLARWLHWRLMLAEDDLGVDRHSRIKWSDVATGKYDEQADQFAELDFFDEDEDE